MNTKDRWKGKWGYVRKNWQLYIFFLLPALVLTFIFKYIPMGGVLLAFKDYNAFKGNAYGLANTLSQTAFLKPKIQNKKLKNVFYTGQLTTPGPGVPPSIISGKVVANLVHKKSLKKTL